MMLWKDGGGSDFEQPPVGTHVAICFRIIDLGTQKGEYQGKPNFKRQNIISWELPNELMTEGDASGKPFVVGKFYTASLGEKANLRADLRNWRGKDFTPEELAGFKPQNILSKVCMLSLTMNDKGKVKVTGVMALPKGTIIPSQVNPNVYFSLDEFDQKVFDSLSDGFKKMIIVSPEYQNIMNTHQKSDGGIMEMEDDIPF
jgi:hypothetical protein